jgi:hypothetical protein
MVGTLAAANGEMCEVASSPALLHVRRLLHQHILRKALRFETARVAHRAAITPCAFDRAGGRPLDAWRLHALATLRL